jgi:hypothetical protein
MHRRAIWLPLCGAVLLCFPNNADAGGTSLTPLQTRSTAANGALVPTDWGPGTSGVNSPLGFDQFDPKLGKLTAIDITLTTNVRNDYVLVFVQTPKITTIDVATSATSDPSILNDPAKRALLTDGPTITLFAPNGSTQLFGPPATRQPVDFVQMTEPSGVFSSLLPITDPNHIEPTITQQMFSRSITSADSASLFAEFIGSGKVDLPITANSFSSFFSSSGNGGGTVLTKANGIVTLQYEYLAIPEPSSIVLLAAGIGVVLIAARARRRTARLS